MTWHVNDGGELFVSLQNVVTIVYTSPVKDINWHHKCARRAGVSRRGDERERRVVVACVHPPAVEEALADPDRQAEGSGAARAVLARGAPLPVRRHADGGQDLQPGEADAREQAQDGLQVGLHHGRTTSVWL